MTFTTHMIIGALAAKPFMASNPVLGFGAAVASHYLADAIPHWDYHLYSLNPKKRGLEDEVVINFKNIALDLARISFDTIFGLFIIYFVFQPVFTFASLWPLALAAFGGILPDVLQPIYWLFWKKWPLSHLQRFHHWMHAQKRLGSRPVLGISSQLAIDIAAIILLLL